MPSVSSRALDIIACHQSIMVAAVADVSRLGILHCDSDYDLLIEKTDLKFSSVWLAARGSL